MSEAALSELCGRRADRAVDAVLALWRVLWVLARSQRHAESANGARLFPRGLVKERAVEELGKTTWLAGTGGALARQPIAERLLSGLAPRASDRNIGVHRQDFCAFDLVARMLDGVTDVSDLRYLTGRSLRSEHSMKLSAATIGALHTYTSRLQAWFRELDEPLRQHHGMFLLRAQGDLARDEPVANPEELSPEVYFQLAAATGWIWPAPAAGEIEIDPSRFDAEKLSGQYFGLPTAIRGLDTVFGESGPLIVDAPVAARAEGGLTACSQPIGGRTFLLTGPYGTGKSTLTLEMGIEVARKGGVTIVAAMEQSVEECLCAMESLGLPTTSDRFVTVSKMLDAMPVLGQEYNGKGVLAFLPIQRAADGATETRRFRDFQKAIEDRFRWMQTYPLRLLIVDPINGVLERNVKQQVGRRQQLVSLFQKAKQLGINIWLTRESSGDIETDPPLEENIADTVLHLGFHEKDGTPRRTIEVKKSRLQRAEPGRHSLSMSSGRGVQIYPSATAVLRMTAETPSRPRVRVATRTNVQGLDRILREGAVLCGDTVALAGEPGSSRTLLGVHFLLGSDPRDERESGTPTSLFVSDSEEARLRSQIELIEQRMRGLQAADSGGKRLDDVRFCSIPAGCLEPSQILQWIGDHFHQAKREGRYIDRVLVADLSRWESGMPPVEHDSAFGPALTSLLRSSGATSMLLADSAPGDQMPMLAEFIVNDADCVLHFDRFEVSGTMRQFVRTTKSRQMAHRRDLFELVVDRRGVHIEPHASLFRIDAAGNVRSVKIRLFLHADSPHHHDFNERLVGAIRTSLTDAEVEEQWSHYDPEMFRLSASSAVDEVQIMQLDEFQLPNPSDSEVGERLFLFRPEEAGEWRHDVGQLLDRLGKRILAEDGVSYMAVPFYQNISVLARHKQRLEGAEKLLGADGPELDKLDGAAAWERLRDIAVKWELQGEEYQFFSCPFAQPQTVETYNCLFFEILRTYLPELPKSDCQLVKWLMTPEAKQAAGIFRDLCYRSHRHELRYFEKAKPGPKGRKLRMFTAQFDSCEKGPVVWRHWYNTLSQMMWDLPAEERSAISVHPLPNQVTSAGEWYLIVPAYSAAPDLAWQIIQLITSPERELQRIYHGVGLPTRVSYYLHPSTPTPASLVSPFFHISRDTLRDLVNGAFQRSEFPCYQRMTETISAHLQKILDLPPQTQTILHDQVNSVMDHLSESMEYIRDSTVCRTCGPGAALRVPDGLAVSS